MSKLRSVTNKKPPILISPFKKKKSKTEKSKARDVTTITLRKAGSKVETKAKIKTKLKPNLKPNTKPDHKISAPDAAASKSSFTKALIRLRKERSDGDYDTAYQNEIYKAMLTATNRLIGATEKAIHRFPENSRHVYSYNNLISQSREIMHDMRSIQLVDHQADKILSIIQQTMSVIVHNMFDMITLHRTELKAQLDVKKHKILNAKTDILLKQTTTILQENYKSLQAAIQALYKPVNKRLKRP